MARTAQCTPVPQLWTPTEASWCSLCLVSFTQPPSQDPVPLSSPPAIALTPRMAVYYSIAVSAVEGPLDCFKVGPVVDKADMDILLGTFGETGL